MCETFIHLSVPAMSTKCWTLCTYGKSVCVVYNIYGYGTTKLVTEETGV